MLAATSEPLTHLACSRRLVAVLAAHCFPTNDTHLVGTIRKSPATCGSELHGFSFPAEFKSFDCWVERATDPFRRFAMITIGGVLTMGFDEDLDLRAGCKSGVASPFDDHVSCLRRTIEIRFSVVLVPASSERKSVNAMHLYYKLLPFALVVTGARGFANQASLQGDIRQVAVKLRSFGIVVGTGTLHYAAG
jgi:hypothetical protein